MTSALPVETVVATQPRPLIWVKKLAVLQSIDPWTEIRQIKFTPGLNIVQGESNETEGAFQSGHGVGKSTVCRLIRYCLGEKSYGQKHIVEEVTHCFPDGYVGAEIELAGTLWAVLLPLGKRTKKFACEGIELDGLLQAEDAKRYDDFIDSLSNAVLSHVAVHTSLTAGQTLLWLHVLAMCSRDQESRYDRFWNWREKRSDSGSPAFDKPKVDAGLTVRTILGLLDPNETKLRNTIDELEARHKYVHDELRREREMPSTLIVGLRTRLHCEYGIQGAMESNLSNDLFEINSAVETRLQTIRAEMERIDDELLPLNRQINLTAASLLEPGELAEQLQSASEVTAEGTHTLLSQLQELQLSRQFIRDAENALCRYGRVQIGACSHVQTRIQEMDAEIRNQQRTVLPTVSEREQIAARLADQARRQQSIITQMQQRLDRMGRERDELIERRRNLRNQANQIPVILDEIKKWQDVSLGRMPNTKIQQMEMDIQDTETKIASAKADLASLIAEQVERAKQFASRFDSLVQRTLTTEYRGVVDIEEDGVNFRIVRGESLSGEAYETLAILLADLALLLESQAGHSHHPGLLIHDSPREADLNLGIYRRLLDMAEETLRPTGNGQECPFQYIVSTTTLPSKALQKKSITKLVLSSGEGALFKRQLEIGKPATEILPLFEKDGAS